MLQHGDPRAGIGYVTLGLFSNAVLRELFAIVDSAGELRKSPAIQAAIDSLNDLEHPGSATGVSGRLRFRGYEAVVTLCDVLESSDYHTPTEVANLLQSVLAPQQEDRLKQAEAGISFFRQLSRQASINSQVPQQDVPAGVRQLAREATA